MVKVTQENLLSEPRNNVLSFIKSDVSDPVSSSSEFRKWIYSREPDAKGSNFNGYPILIAHPATTEMDQDTSGATISGTKQTTTFQIDVEIISSDRGYGDNDGNGLSYLDSVSNSIMKTFLNVDNRNQLRLWNMSFSKPVASPVLVEGFKEELVYRRVISLPFTTPFLTISE